MGSLVLTPPPAPAPLQHGRRRVRARAVSQTDPLRSSITYLALIDEVWRSRTALHGFVPRPSDILSIRVHF